MTHKDLTVLFEDNHIIVVVKPINVPVQEDETGDLDMLTMVKQYLIDKYNKPGDAFVGLVHRLDRPTGGVMVFAKTSKAASRLSEQIRNGEVEKKYLTIVCGVPEDPANKLICYLKKFPDENIVRVVPELTEGAKYAELDYKMLTTNNKYSLLQVNLITGRSHQIRVQMANMGNPILGDAKYGMGDKLKLPLCLWAAELRFSHPVSKEKMVFRVYPPEITPWTMFNIDAFLNINIRNS